MLPLTYADICYVIIRIISNSRKWLRENGWIVLINDNRALFKTIDKISCQMFTDIINILVIYFSPIYNNLFSSCMNSSIYCILILTPWRCTQIWCNFYYFFIRVLSARSVFCQGKPPSVNLKFLPYFCQLFVISSNFFCLFRCGSLLGHMLVRPDAVTFFKVKIFMLKKMKH